LAGSDFYRALDHEGAITGIRGTGEIVGTIVQCPRAANQNQFHILWMINTSGLVPSRFRLYYPGTEEIKLQLQEAAMIRHDKALETGDLPHILATTLFGGVHPESAVLPVPPAAKNALPPSIPHKIATPQWYAAVANLVTAAGSVAGDSLSTLTHSVSRDGAVPRLLPPVEPLLDTGRYGPPTTGRSSRSTGSLESESNDGSNLDEDDDAWENLNEGLDYDDDEDDIRTDENHRDDPPFLPPPEEGDGNILEILSYLFKNPSLNPV
jgi:hypothetical protein